MFSDKNQKYWLLSCISLLLLSIVFLVFSAYNSYASAKEAVKPIDEKLALIVSDVSKSQLDKAYNLKRIMKVGLFHVQAPEIKKVKAKKTQLRLKLNGIVAAQGENLSRAIISTNNKKAITYEVGQKIEGTNAELDSVEPDRVLLSRAGVLESLELERKKLK